MIAFRLWAGEEILPGDPPVAVATATPSAITPGQIVKFDSSQSKDKDIKVTWQETKEGYKYNFQREEIDGKVLTWSWTFGDGNTGEGKTTTHKYTQPGEYTVKLTITADHDESVTASITVKVSKCPVCERLKAERTRLEAELSQKRTELEKIENELKILEHKKEIIERELAKINKELEKMGKEGMALGESFFEPETNKWRFLYRLLKVPFRMGKDAKRFVELGERFLKLQSEKKEVEDRIKELEPQRDRLNGEIEKIEKRIDEIDKDIASCKFPPTH